MDEQNNKALFTALEDLKVAYYGLRSAFFRYCRHEYECGTGAKNRECTCGLDAIIKLAQDTRP